MDGRTDGRGDGRGMDGFLLAVVISSDISIPSELGLLQGCSLYVFCVCVCFSKGHQNGTSFFKLSVIYDIPDS